MTDVDSRSNLAAVGHDGDSRIGRMLPTPITGKADWRSYRAVELKNGVTVLVVNDPQSKTTAMSCLVNVGAAYDPRSLSGLAHFTEHMCFLGSQKYPVENEYKRYLSSHGGRSNASTSMHVTNYKFEVVAAHAEQAVDIFSNFFVAPLFSQSGTSREVNAVDSENSKNLVSDGRRRLQILKSLASQDHWYSKFSTGNSHTIQTNDPTKLEFVRNALLTFHRKHYRPENMTVVIAGPQSLDVLQEWVVSRYSQIPNSQPSTTKSTDEIEQLIEDAAKDAPPYGFRNLGLESTINSKATTTTSVTQNSPFSPQYQPGQKWPVLLTTKPLRSMRKLVLMWPLPSTFYVRPDQCPTSAASHLLGHEGAGSIFATLQNLGWASSLSAGSRTSAPDFNLFQVDIGLTEKGEHEWQNVVDVVFAYCRMLNEQATVAKTKKSSGQDDDLSRIWGEAAALDRIHFDHSSPNGTFDYAPVLADRVVCYGTEHCRSAGHMLNEDPSTFPLDEFLEVTKLLTPRNCIIERCSEAAYEDVLQKLDHLPPGFGLQKEKWYDIDYYLSPIDESALSSWEGSNADPLSNKSTHAELALPKPNRYIPRTLELCPDLPEEARQGQRIEKPIDPPVLIVNEPNWRLFHRLDDRYALPKSSLYFLIRTVATQNVPSPDSDEWIFDEKSSLMSSILAGMFNEAMAQETYDADLAGLHWSLSAGSAGIKIHCDGYSDRLPDLGLKVLDDFLSGDWIKEQYFNSTRDRVVRGLRTYFESRRADAHAVYYRDSLMASKDQGVRDSLNIAVEMHFDDVVSHHTGIFRTAKPSVDCLFAGNVSAEDASTFFAKARSLVEGAIKRAEADADTDSVIPSGALERQLELGEEVQLHFASENPEELNGAVLCTYQSSIPSFRGDGMSDPSHLHSSSAIRLICHMLREPLFNDLRTKQQLGYVVHSYYEVGYSAKSYGDDVVAKMTPVDFISINVLSRKISPPEILDRIDEFLEKFRNSLVQMPESEIRDHADALAEKLRKPIHKLQTEASSRFMRIQRYGPEIFGSHSSNGAHSHAKPVGGPSSIDMPWDTAESLAACIQSLTRQDLVETWDRITNPSTRTRVVSCVYGKTFPLKKEGIPDSGKVVESKSGLLSSFLNRGRSIKTTKIYTFPALLEHRKTLTAFDGSSVRRNMSASVGNGGRRVGGTVFQQSSRSSLMFSDAAGGLNTLNNQHRFVLVGLGVLGAAAAIGLGISTASNRSTKNRPF